jgi:hypothetical protein
VAPRVDTLRHRGGGAEACGSYELVDIEELAVLVAYDDIAATGRELKDRDGGE